MNLNLQKTRVFFWAVLDFNRNLNLLFPSVVFFLGFSWICLHAAGASSFWVDFILLLILPQKNDTSKTSWHPNSDLVCLCRIISLKINPQNNGCYGLVVACAGSMNSVQHTCTPAHSCNCGFCAWCAEPSVLKATPVCWGCSFCAVSQTANFLVWAY